MKIGLDHINALRQANEAQKPKAGPAEGFSGMLDQAIMNQQAVQSASMPTAGPGKLMANPLLETQAILNGSNEMMVGNPATDEKLVIKEFEGLLSKWEQYAVGLDPTTSESGLRQAFGVLEDINSGVKQLKEEWPNMGKDSPQIKSMIDELEVLAVTEQIKFNRGDYF